MATSDPSPALGSLSKVAVGDARAADYSLILGLNEAAVPNVNSISAATLQALHEQAVALCVARDPDQPDILAGFLLALDRTADYGSVNFGWFKSHYQRFTYVDRVVVNPDYRRAGVGRKLYQRLFETTSTDQPVTCEVNLQPPNPGSLAFHSHLGFAQVGEQDTEGGSKRVALLARGAASISAPG